MHEDSVGRHLFIQLILSELDIANYVYMHCMAEQRFVPSEFGNEVDRVSGLPPFQAILDNKKKIRRATKEAGIPYTYVSANSLGAYFVDYLLHPRQAPPSDEVVIYGSGEAKAVLNYEEDVAAYTVMAVTDPRASNRLIIVRPPANIASQLDLVSSWEKKTGRTLKRTHVAEQEMIELSQSLPFPDNVPVAILHNIFIKGDQMSFQLTEQDLEASAFYPHHKYTSVDQLLDSCLLNPPNPKLSTFS